MVFSLQSVLSQFMTYEKRNEAFRSDFNERVTGLAPSLLCGLLLAGANRQEENECILTAEEVSAMNLSRCELAVLSACESNVGHKRAGLCIISLQRAFSIAGVKRSVTSLWKVDDKATRKLMEHFYN